MNSNYRKIQNQKQSILNHNQELEVGVFEDYFKEFNLLNKQRPFLKKFINYNSLTEWQAVEVLEGDIFLICAVFKFGVMNRTLFFLYDIVNNELHDYSSMSFTKHKSKIAKSLENKSLSTRKTKKTTLNITNELNLNKLYLKGTATDVEFDIEFTRIARPSVVSIPMTEKHVVYTEKDLLVPKGYIKFKGKVYSLTEKHISILDDHRGYYPLSSGYDWVTCMGDITVKDKLSKFGVNLTYFYKNLDQNSYNENGYWFEGTYYQLPVVRFQRENNLWYIKDDNGIVDLIFTVNNYSNEKKRIGLKIDYTLAFGSLTGVIKTPKGIDLIIDNMFALGEERKTQFMYQKTMS